MAATGVEIANAYLALTVKAPGIKKDIVKELGGVDASGAGTQIANKLSTAMKRTLQATGAGIAGVLGTALVKGFGRLKAIETAQAKMRGLGYDSGVVAQAMDNALASVKGTAFGLGDAATAAGQLMAANIKPGEQLEGVLKTVANNASAAGISFDEMGSIFARAASQANGVQNDVISQLADRGIPIYQALADQMGVTAGEVFKMASEGKISFEVFERAAASAAGTVADEMGNTTTGAFDNMMAALGRLGAKILEDVFPLIGPLFKEITGWLDQAAVHVEPVVDWLGARLPGAIQSVRDFFSGLFSWVNANKDWLVPVAVGIGTVITAVKTAQIATAAWKGTTAAFKAVQAAYVAYAYGMAGATCTYEGASKAGAIATKLFNAALRANPIGIIVTAVLALAAGLVYFFTQTETGKKVWAEFTRFLGEAWANISSFFQSVWENVLKPVFEGIGQVFSFVWNSILKPVFDAIAAVAKWVFENILLPQFQLAQFAFAVLGGIFQGIWDFILKPVFEAIGRIFEWIWNAVISPVVGWIQEKWQILGLAAKIMWERFIKPAIDAVGKAFQWIWTNVISPVVDWIKNKIQLMGLGFQILWATYVQPVFDAIAAIFNWIWTNIIQPVIGWIQEKIALLGLGFRIMYEQYIKPAWDSVAKVIQTVWNKVKSIIDTMVRVVKSDPKQAFEAARDAIGAAWAGIQELAKKPVRFVVDTVINGLIDTINLIPGVNLPRVNLPRGFAQGGILPGYSRMSNGDDQLIAARRGEGIMVSEALRTGADKAAFLAANAAGRRGVGFASLLQGLARGGLVTPLPAGSWRVSQPYHGGHNGLDMAAASGTPVMAAANGVVGLAGVVPMGGNEVYIQHTNGLGTRYSHLSRFASRAGNPVRQGQVIGYVGSTGMSTGPHLHYMVHSPGRGGGFYGSHVNPAPYLSGNVPMLGEAWNPLEGLIDFVTDKIKGAFPEGGMWVDAAAGLAKDAARRAVEVFTPKIGADGHTATLYDSGGWLPTGFSLVENRSRTPEPILSGSQWADIGRLAERGAGGGDGRAVFHLYDSDGVLMGTIDGRIEDAASAVSSRSLNDRLGV
ncbi:peptidoglycan DD-metalloendopeptidase family protein [Leucobacter muris]|uniref:peptidoglycan DD-metalloendopeptidase family protein n=1 Tax=Leucobacter muris TaxID=1935379 RepID=UPI0013E28FE1|nr:peptidoglycan DD-metalloendopeptidase family protein [Leucobacter muris]